MRVLLERLDLQLRRLDRIRGRGIEAYLAGEELRLATERTLQLALQIAIDLGAHLVSELGLGAPDDYRGVFVRLHRDGILDAALAERLGRAAGLRNLLVHGYQELDDRRVFAALGELDDLRAFAAAAFAAAERS